VIRNPIGGGERWHATAGCTPSVDRYHSYRCWRSIVAQTRDTTLRVRPQAILLIMRGPSQCSVLNLSTPALMHAQHHASPARLPTSIHVSTRTRWTSIDAPQGEPCSAVRRPLLARRPKSRFRTIKSKHQTDGQSDISVVCVRAIEFLRLHEGDALYRFLPDNLDPSMFRLHCHVTHMAANCVKTRRGSGQSSSFIPSRSSTSVDAVQHVLYDPRGRTG
jgi:hypothetical protein